MRIISLAPFLTTTLRSLGVVKSLVAVTALCDREKAEQDLFVVPIGIGEVITTVLLEPLKKLQPTHVFLPPAEGDSIGILGAAKSVFDPSVKVLSFAPKSFEQLLQFFKDLGAVVGAESRGVEIASKIKAQAMDWADNFYARTRSKRVTVLSSREPLRLAGLWIPELVRLVSAVSQNAAVGEPHELVTWEQVVQFRPDVLIVAPEGATTEQSMRSFKEFEKLPHWEELPAVKRGEVIFCGGGDEFYTPTPHLINGMAILFSAIAGFESGYITERDSFYRLRWLELQRHRL